MATNKMSNKSRIGQMCVVPDCASVYYPGCGIRFHLFPKDISKRNKWLKRLNLSLADYQEGATICYLHFNFSDYCNNDPMNKLKLFALPHATKNQPASDSGNSDVESITVETALKMLEEVSSSYDNDSNNENVSLTHTGEERKKKKKVIRKQKPATSIPTVSDKKKEEEFIEIKLEEIEGRVDKKVEEKFYELCVLQPEPDSTEPKSIDNVLTSVCKTCLATECKMYSIKQYNLEQTYLHVTGVSGDIFNDTKMPQTVCFECLKRLQNFIKFSTKSLTAWSLLMELIEDNRLSMDSIKSIDRDKSFLSSKLAFTMFEPNYFNTHVEEYEENDSENLATAEDRNESIEKVSEEVQTYIDLREDFDLGNTFEVKEEIEVETLVNNQEYVEQPSENGNDENNEPSRIDDSQTSKRRKKFRKKYIRGYNEKFIVKSLTTEEHAELENRKLSSEYQNAVYKCNKCYTGFDSESLFNEHIEAHNSVTDNIHAIDSEQNVITTKNPIPQFVSFDMQVEEYEYENQDNVEVIYNNEEIVTISTDNEESYGFDSGVSNNNKEIEESNNWEEDEDNDLQEKRNSDEYNDTGDDDDGVGSKKIKVDNDDFDDLFTVKLMTPKEQAEQFERRKVRNNYENKKFTCQICFRGYQMQKSYDGHMRKHTAACGKYECAVCHIRFQKHPYLVKHMSNAHEKLISCRRCSFTTPHELAANEHRKNHSGVRFQCKLCPKNYLKHTTFLDHIRRCHPGDVICHLCGLSFAHISDLDTHFGVKHRKEDLHIQPSTTTFPFGTLQRNKMSSNPNNIAVSYISTLPDTAPSCSKCNTRFRDDAALASHLTYSPSHGNLPRNKPRRPQSGKNKKKESVPYVCEECGEEFVNYQSYTIHFGRSHPDKHRTQYRHDRPQYICDLCGKAYQNVTNLNDHRQSHSGAKPHSCNICSKTFKTKMTLSAHKLNHTHVLKCKECGKSFTQFTNLRRHRLLHTEKPYSCEPCGKRFVSPTDKRAHIQHHHLGLPWPKRPRKGKSDDVELVTAEQSIQSVVED